MNLKDPDNMDRNRIDALLALMGRLADLHDELHLALRDKLASMRTAGLEDLHACVDRERVLAVRINEQEGLRKQMMEQVGRGYGMSPTASRALSARNLALHLSQPHRRKLEEVSLRLRTAVERVRRANDFVGRVSAQVLQHVRGVFAAVSEGATSGCAYTKRGGGGSVDHAVGLFEAIG